MKRLKPWLFLALAALPLAACSKSPSSPVATVDVGRISANWPKFINYQNQLTADSAALDRANISASERRRQSEDLQRRYAQRQDELTSDMRQAAETVAGERHFQFVVTREFVGYGGVDITADIEKILKITESSTPAP